MFKEVEKCADNHDIIGLRYIFIDCFAVDPTFENYLEEYEYCCKKCPDMFVPHKEMKVSLTNDKSKWTLDYWDQVKLDQHYNFSKKRFEFMRRIAPVVFSEKVDRLEKERKERAEKEKQKNSENKPPTQEEHTDNKTYVKDPITGDFITMDEFKKRAAAGEYAEKVSEDDDTKGNNKEESSVPIQKMDPTRFQRFKATLISGFSKLIDKIEGFVRKWRDSKIKGFLLKLLQKAKMGLSKSKSLNAARPELAQRLKQEADNIQSDLDRIENNQKAAESFIGFCDNMMI